MAPKGGTVVLLLVVVCAFMAEGLHMRPENKPDFERIAKKLMRKCQDMGYPEPQMTLLNTVFNSSDSSMMDRNAGQSNSLLSLFKNILQSVSTAKDSLSRVTLDDSTDNSNMMWNCSSLPTMISHMRNSSEESACYMYAFVAPLSWTTLTTQTEDNIDSDDYGTLLWAAKPVLQNMAVTTLNLPIKVSSPNMKHMMKMLLEVYKSMSEEQKTRVVRWIKEQITENDFNCTTTPSQNSKLRQMERCKPSLQWLNTEYLAMMGPFLSNLEPNDVDSSPKENLCDFFCSAQFKSALKVATMMNPSLAKRFLKRFQECFSKTKDFAAHVDKLGILACYYNAAPDLTPDLSGKLLSELDNCNDRNNPRIKTLKKNLVNSVISSNSVGALRDLGNSITLLSPKQLSSISSSDLKEVINNLGPSIQWTQGQIRTLVKKKLGDKKCAKMSAEELMDLKSVAEGLPNCVLKHVKAQEILNDTETLKNISKRMRKSQLKALLQGLSEGINSSELLEKLDSNLLRSVSLSSLAKVNISFDKVVEKTWSVSQAACLAKKMDDKKNLQYRRLRSVLQGVTCEMINKAVDQDVQELVQAITETPQWLSKVLAGCTAQKLFGMLEKERVDYFKTITEEEMNKIPTVLLVHLPPSKLKDLPDSVCPIFLDKMEEANLSSLPLRAPCRPALTQKALLCMSSGTDLSRLSTEDVSRLGPLLCELSPSQLRLMSPNVLNSSLQAMASCQHIPEHHRMDLIQLVTQTFGDPFNWTAETMEELGPFLLLDDNATSALPNEPWMKDVLYFLKARVFYISSALKRKLFDLTTTTTSNTARKKREANSNNNGVGNGNTGSSSGTGSSTSTDSSIDSNPVITAEMIEEHGMNNVYWTAAQLDQMSVVIFLATVEILGKIPDYSADQLAVLSKKAVEAFGPVSKMTESEVEQMGCIAQGFSDAALKTLPFLLESLYRIAHCGWNESQLESVWKAVAKYNNLTAEGLGAVEMIELQRFICGLNSSEISQLNMDAFKEAVGSMDGVQCSFKVAQHLKSLAVSAFGDPSTWTQAQVSDLGNIIAGLDAAELASLDPSVCPFLSESCIPLIPPNNFAALSVAHLEALGPDNAAMVTSEQKLALRDVQLAALERALTGSRNQTLNSNLSGAPSLSVEGISAFTKPLLFLLTGFLLL